MTHPPRIKVPKSVRAGETVEVRAVVRHPMERGQHKDASGRDVARNIIHSFRATFNGDTVFEADFGTGISANPFIAFYLKVTAPGLLELVWEDDRGQVIRGQEQIAVSEA